MTSTNFPERARELVYAHIKDRLEPTEADSFTLDHVYTVSFHFVLGSWKALVSTTLPDGMYYEVTRDLSNKATYVTSYKQWEHKTYFDEGEG